MSPPAICCGTRPSFCITTPAEPPMRILRPFMSATVFRYLRKNPRIEAERDRTGKNKRRILAEEIVGRGMAALNGCVLYRVEHLQAGDDFAGSKYLDLELAVGAGGHALRNHFGG